MSHTIVSMRFRLQPGHSKEEWLKANAQVNDRVRQQPGFRYRSLSETGDGEWLVIGCWTSAEAAEAANPGFARQIDGALSPFIDMASFNLTRSTARLMLRREPAAHLA
jgi:quinol monooxygenase YgiN